MVCLAPGRIEAQVAGWGLLLPVGPDSDGQRAWRSRIEHGQGPESAEVVHGLDWLRDSLALSEQNIARDDLRRLAEVETGLLQARVHAAKLAEPAALTELVAAERTLQSLLHLPGASAFYVEVQTAIGLVAAQAQRLGLAEAAQRRASVVDPSRGVRAAEAAPGWVQRANEIALEVASAPVGEVEVVTQPAGARVFLDDNLLGTTPTTLRVTRGVHVLRVEADGYRAFGALLPVDAGARPAVRVELERDPVVTALSRLAAAAAAPDQPEVRRTLRALQVLGAPVASVWMVRTNPLRDDRALLTRCTVDDCARSRRLELDDVGADVSTYGQPLDPAGFGRDHTARDLAWLHATDAPHVPSAPALGPSAWWSRWYVWSAAAALVGGAVALGAAATAEPDTQRLRVTIDP